MEKSTFTEAQETVEAAKEQPLDMPIESAAVRRLIEEIRSDDLGVSRSYNRTFNRHNR